MSKKNQAQVDPASDPSPAGDSQVSPPEPEASSHEADAAAPIVEVPAEPQIPGQSGVSDQAVQRQEVAQEPIAVHESIVQSGWYEGAIENSGRRIVFASSADEATAKLFKALGVTSTTQRVSVGRLEGYEPTAADLELEALLSRE